MAANWGTDKNWSDQFMPHVEILILRSVLCVSIGSAREDQEENTDLRIYSVRLPDTSPSLRVAVRIRRAHYMERYPHQVTFRSDRPQSGNATELEKMWNGLGDLFLYGFGDEEKRRVAEWVVLDLRELRANRSRLEYAWSGPMRNGDGSSAFMALHLDHVPTPMRVGLIRTASEHYRDMPDQSKWCAQPIGVSPQLMLLRGGKS